MLELLGGLLVLVLGLGLIYYVLNAVPLPPLIQQYGTILLVVIGCVCILALMLPILGIASPFPRLTLR